VDSGCSGWQSKEEEAEEGRIYHTVAAEIGLNELAV
jgi:hypothetical protein